MFNKRLVKKIISMVILLNYCASFSVQSFIPPAAPKLVRRIRRPITTGNKLNDQLKGQLNAAKKSNAKKITPQIPKKISPLFKVGLLSASLASLGFVSWIMAKRYKSNRIKVNFINHGTKIEKEFNKNEKIGKVLIDESSNIGTGEVYAVLYDKNQELSGSTRFPLGSKITNSNGTSVRSSDSSLWNIEEELVVYHQQFSQEDASDLMFALVTFDPSNYDNNPDNYFLKSIPDNNIPIIKNKSSNQKIKTISSAYNTTNGQLKGSVFQDKTIDKKNVDNLIKTTEETIKKLEVKIDPTDSFITKLKESLKNNSNLKPNAAEPINETDSNRSATLIELRHNRAVYYFYLVGPRDEHTVEEHLTDALTPNGRWKIITQDSQFKIICKILTRNFLEWIDRVTISAIPFKDVQQALGYFSSVDIKKVNITDHGETKQYILIVFSLNGNKHGLLMLVSKFKQLKQNPALHLKEINEGVNSIPRTMPTTLPNDGKFSFHYGGNGHLIADKIKEEQVFDATKEMPSQSPVGIVRDDVLYQFIFNGKTFYSKCPIGELIISFNGAFSQNDRLNLLNNILKTKSEADRNELESCIVCKDGKNFELIHKDTKPIPTIEQTGKLLTKANVSGDQLKSEGQVDSQGALDKMITDLGDPSGSKPVGDEKPTSKTTITVEFKAFNSETQPNNIFIEVPESFKVKTVDDVITLLNKSFDSEFTEAEKNPVIEQLYSACYKCKKDEVKILMNVNKNGENKFTITVSTDPHKSILNRYCFGIHSLTSCVKQYCELNKLYSLHCLGYCFDKCIFFLRLFIPGNLFKVIGQLQVGGIINWLFDCFKEDIASSIYDLENTTKEMFGDVHFNKNSKSLPLTRVTLKNPKYYSSDSTESETLQGVIYMEKSKFEKLIKEKDVDEFVVESLAAYKKCYEATTNSELDKRYKGILKLKGKYSNSLRRLGLKFSRRADVNDLPCWFLEKNQ